MEVKIFVCILFIFNSIHFCLAGFFWNCNRKRIFIALLSTTLSHCSSCPTHYSRAKRSSVRSIGRTCKESFKVQSCQIAAENLERAWASSSAARAWLQDMQQISPWSQKDVPLHLATVLLPLSVTFKKLKQMFEYCKILLLLSIL